MKLIEQSAARMLFEEKSGVLENVFGLLWLGIPSIVMAMTIFQAGVTTVRCNRVEPTIIACQRKQTHAFDLMDDGITTVLGDFTGATVVTETRTDEDGDPYTVDVLYGKTVDGDQKKLGLTQGVERTAAQINRFIAAPTPETLTLTQDSRFTPSTLMGLLMSSVFVTFGLAMVMKPQEALQLDIDKSQRRLRLQVVRKRRSPRILEELSLKEITAIALVEDTDDDDDTYYTAVIQARPSKSIKVMRRYTPEPVKDIVRQLQAFLGLPDTPNTLTPVVTPTPSPAPASDQPWMDPSFPPGQIFYTTEAGIRYQSFDRDSLRADHRQRLEAWEAELERLQFTPLGSFTTSRFPSLIIHGFVHPQMPINAGILQTESMKAMVDLVSICRDGASLTTSTMPGAGDIPHANIFRNSYPNASLPELFSHHRERLTQLSTEHGGLSPASTDLVQLAMVIEDYFQREPSGPFHVLKTFATQLGILLFNRKALIES